MTPVIVTLAGPPRGKERPRFTKRGRVYTPAKTRAYEARLRKAAVAAMAGRKPFDGPLAMDVFAVMPIPKSWSKKKKALALLGLIRPTVKPDWDNVGKISDAFSGVVFEDDKQVVDATVSKFYGAEPRLRIAIYQAKNPLPTEQNYGEPTCHAVE